MPGTNVTSFKDGGYVWSDGQVIVNETTAVIQAVKDNSFRWGRFHGTG